MSAVLDTTVLIDILRGSDGARRFAAALDEVPACSEVSRVEVLQGLGPSERSAADRLMSDLDWAVVDEDVARRAGEFGRRFRRSHSHVSVPDLLIAATAAKLDLPLATSNVRHFPMFPGLRPPYSP